MMRKKFGQTSGFSRIIIQFSHARPALHSRESGIFEIIVNGRSNVERMNHGMVNDGHDYDNIQYRSSIVGGNYLQ